MNRGKRLITLESNGGFQVSGAGTIANIEFDTTTSILQADSGTSTFINAFHFTGAEGQVRMLGAATMNVQNSFNSDSTADFSIFGTLNVNNTAPVIFSNAASITLNVNAGKMTLSNTGIWSLQTSGTGKVGIDGGASFTYTGGAGATGVAMPIYNAGTATLIGGTLDVNANGIAAYAWNQLAGTTVLKSGVTLSATPKYYQTGGTLSVADTTPASIDQGADIEGGKVTLGTVSQFGKLQVTNGFFEVNNAEFDAKVNGAAGGNGNSDEIVASNKSSIGVQSSTLKVTVLGNLGNGLTWTLMLGPNNSSCTFNWATQDIAPLQDWLPNAWTFGLKTAS